MPIKTSLLPKFSKGAAASTAPAPMRGTHATQVFGGPFPAAETAQFARDAVAAGDAVILLLHKSRLAGMRRRLAGTKAVVYHDTHAVLEAMSQDDALQEAKVRAVLEGAVAEAAKLGRGGVTILTDAAGTLIQAGRAADSRLLERICHGYCHTGSVFLTCIYPAQAYTALSPALRNDFRHEHHLARASA